MISQLKSGDSLVVNGHDCLDGNGQPLLKFSTQFVEQIGGMRERGYELKSVKVNFVVYWLKEAADREVLIVLPEVWFVRSDAAMEEK